MKLSEKIVNINDLYEFKDNPYRVKDNEDMEDLTESIKQYGIIEPLIVRKRDKGGYGIISGHRRKYACKKAGIKQIPVLIRNMDKNTAIITLVDSNLQRSDILPSVEISYLKEQEQKDLIETIESEDSTPSYSQAIRMKELSKQNKLDMDTIFNIMTEQKPNQKEQIKFKIENIKSYFPKGYSIKQMENIIESLLKQYKQKWNNKNLGR